MKGCIHIYTGDGKGKTSAAAGLAIRFAASGRRVLFAQFLKDGSSGEILVLSKVPGITCYPCRKKFSFSFLMSNDEKEKAVSCYSAYLWKILEKSVAEDFDMLVLDEAITAYNLCFFDNESLLKFLREKPEEMEIVLTGRDAVPDLIDLADYVSEIKKIKHPFDEGLTARKGIEY